MNPKQLFEAFFFNHKLSEWEAIDAEIKGQMFNYIISACIKKDLKLASKLMRMAHNVPKGVCREHHRAFILDRYRANFVTNKRSLYNISFFVFPKKIKETEINTAAIEFGLRTIGKSDELQEFLRGKMDKKFVKWCETEYKRNKKYIG